MENTIPTIRCHYYFLSGFYIVQVLPVNYNQILDMFIYVNSVYILIHLDLSYTEILISVFSYFTLVSKFHGFRLSIMRHILDMSRSLSIICILDI